MFVIGEMPALRINNNRPDLDAPLCLAFNNVIQNSGTGDAEIKDLLATMNELGLNVVKAKPGQSIVLFIYCKTVDSAVDFTQMINSGRLEYYLEIIFNRLLATIIEPNTTAELKSRISLEDAEIFTLEEFTGIEGNSLHLLLLSFK